MKPDHLGNQAWPVSQAILGGCVGKVVELDLVHSPALPTDVDTDVNSHGAKDLVVGGLDPVLPQQSIRGKNSSLQ